MPILCFSLFIAATVFLGDYQMIEWSLKLLRFLRFFQLLHTFESRTLTLNCVCQSVTLPSLTPDTRIGQIQPCSRLLSIAASPPQPMSYQFVLDHDKHVH